MSPARSLGDQRPGKPGDSTILKPVSKPIAKLHCFSAKEQVRTRHVWQSILILKTPVRLSARRLAIRAVMLDARYCRGVIMIESSEFRSARIPLNQGTGQIPVLGFGTLIPDAAATISATRGALQAGFRHFDCAERYRNEHEVGEALQVGLAAGGIAREDIFVTTKLWNSNIGPSAWNRLSRRVWTGSGSGIWISTSFILRLHFNPGTSRTRGIKTAMSSTTTE